MTAKEEFAIAVARAVKDELRPHGEAINALMTKVTEQQAEIEMLRVRVETTAEKIEGHGDMSERESTVNRQRPPVTEETENAFTDLAWRVKLSAATLTIPAGQREPRLGWWNAQKVLVHLAELPDWQLRALLRAAKAGELA